MITSSELARRAGISVTVLNDLVRAGLAEPAERRSRKSGSRSLWSEADVAAIAVMVSARRALARLGRCRVPPLRLRALAETPGLLAVGGPAGVVVKVTPQTTVAQLLRVIGGAFAVLPKDPT